MYNEIADQYESADRFGAMSLSHACAIKQIHDANIGMCLYYKVLDLGVSDGSFLKKISQHMKQASFTGIDLSQQMLERAKKNMPQLTAIEGSPAQASQFLPLHSQDLVLAHFMNAYMPIHSLFDQAALMTRANGHFSFMTTTYDSFPIAQQNLANFIAGNTLGSSVVGHYYKSMVNNTPVSASQHELLSTFEGHQFEVVAHERFMVPIFLKDIDELAHFGMEGTWFLNTLNVSMIPRQFLIERLSRLFEKIFVFPYEDTHVIDVILAKKR